MLHSGGPRAQFLAWLMTVQTVFCGFGHFLCPGAWRDQAVSD